MTDQSGAFPETLREAPSFTVTLDRKQGSTDDMVERELGAILADALMDPHGGTRHIVGYRIQRAALERPRPAPPEPQELHVYESEPTNPGYEGKVTVKKFSELRNAMSPERQQRAHERAEEILTEIRGGTAGTGAAPPDWQAGVELVESSRLPQGIEAAQTGSAVDSAKSPTNSPSYALFDLFSSGGSRPFVGVDQKPDGCWFACVASLTGIPLGDFPEPPTKDTECDVRNAVTKLLHAHGWQMHRLWTIPDAVPRGWAIAGGTSPRNLAHAVVVYDGELVWDPHPSRAGLVAIEEYEVLVPVRAGNALPLRGGAAQPPPSAPDPEVIFEALDCEFRRIGIHHPLEILHRVACCAADALQRVANPDLVRFGVPREETNE